MKRYTVKDVVKLKQKEEYLKKLNRELNILKKSLKKPSKSL